MEIADDQGERKARRIDRLKYYRASCLAVRAWIPLGFTYPAFRLRVREHNICGRDPFISCTINSLGSGRPSNTKIYKVCDVIFREGYPLWISKKRGGGNPSFLQAWYFNFWFYTGDIFLTWKWKTLDWMLFGKAYSFLISRATLKLFSPNRVKCNSRESLWE